MTTLHIVQALARQPTLGSTQLEWCQKVGCLLECRADCVNLMHEILNADDVVLAECALNDGVVCQGDAVAVDLAVTTLVDELLDGLEIGVAPCDVGLNQLEHVDGGLVYL